MPKTLTRYAATLGLCLMTTGSCQQDSPSSEDEYIENPNPGVIEPFCRWETEPTPPEGMIAHKIGAGVLRGELDSCAKLDPIELDSILIEEYKRQVVEGCDPEPFELLRGCYSSSAGSERCLIAAYVFSTCELTTSVE